ELRGAVFLRHLPLRVHPFVFPLLRMLYSPWWLYSPIGAARPPPPRRRDAGRLGARWRTTLERPPAAKVPSMEPQGLRSVIYPFLRGEKEKMPGEGEIHVDR